MYLSVFKLYLTVFTSLVASKQREQVVWPGSVRCLGAEEEEVDGKDGGVAESLICLSEWSVAK